MPQNTYPDGFPLAPLEAINFSYTFSNEEKNEWREWVKTATPEQQQELVDTLHSIWIENQKEVVPTGFNKTVNVFEMQKTESPVPDSTVVESVQQLDEIKPIVKNPAENQPINKIVQEPKESTTEKPQQREFVFNEKPVPANTATQIAEPEKIILENRTESSKNTQRPLNNNTNQVGQNNQGNRSYQSQNNASNNQGGRNKQAMSFFDFTKVRESATREELEKLQTDFLTSRQRKYEMEQTYSSQLSDLTNELDQKQQVLFDKVVQIALNFENVADYLQLMTEKLLQTNESNIALDKKVKSLEILLDEKVKNLFYDKENTQHDIDRLFRESREVRESLRGEILDLKRTSSVSTVDSFGGEGIKIKLDLLSNKIAIIENNIRSQNTQNRQNKQPVSSIKTDNKLVVSDKKKHTNEDDTNKSVDSNTLDISDIV
jgi:hypothetical protein